MANKLNAVEIVESHKPKNYKFKYIITDEAFLQELDDLHYDVSQLDTIQDPDLIDAALQVTEFYTYERDVVAKAKNPTVLDNGVMLAKSMATKTDKKLQKVQVGYFTYDSRKYTMIKLVYEKFEIIELFILL